MSSPSEWMEQQGLSRTWDGAWGRGVCAGLGKHTQVPAWAWRAGFALIEVVGGLGGMLYVLCWALMPPPDGPSPLWRECGRFVGHIQRWWPLANKQLQRTAAARYVRGLVTQEKGSRGS